MNEKTYHLINDFLEGKLQGRALDEFKAKMKDPEFARQVDIQEQIAEAIKAQRKAELKALLAQDEGPAYIQNMWGSRWTYASAAIVILFVSAFFIMKQFASQQDSEELATEQLGDPIPDRNSDTLLPADSGMLAVEEAAEAPGLTEVAVEEMEVVERTEDMTQVDRQILAMTENRSPMLKSDQQGNQPAEDEVMTESLVQISNYSITVLSPEFDRQDEPAVRAETDEEAVEVAADDFAPSAAKAAPQSKDLQVEFWTNPINYKGYRFLDGKLKLYQCHEAGLLSFKELDGRLYLQMAGTHYFIAKDGQDHKFVPVTNETLLGVLND